MEQNKDRCLVIDLTPALNKKIDPSKLSRMDYYNLVIRALLFSTQKSEIEAAKWQVTIDSEDLDTLEFDATKEKISSIGKRAAEKATRELEALCEKNLHPSKDVDPLLLKSQIKESKVENVVFSGDSFSVAGLLGVTAGLKKDNRDKDLKRVGGHAAASIIATLFALNADQKQIETAVLKYNSLYQYFELSLLSRFNLKKGLFPSKDRKNYITELLKDLNVDENITFEEMHKNLKYKDLYIRVFNLSKQQLEVLSFETAPRMKIKDALLIATNTAIYNKPIYLNDKKEITKAVESSDIYVSANICKKSPVKMFDQKKYCNDLSQDLADDAHIINPHTLGFYVKDPTRDKISSINIGLPTVIKSTIDALRHGTEDVITAADDRIVKIKIDKNDPFKKVKQENLLKQRLCEVGYKTIDQYFAGKNNEITTIDKYSVEFPKHKPLIVLIFDHIIDLITAFFKGAIELFKKILDSIIEAISPPKEGVSLPKMTNNTDLSPVL
jgi:hypothetical protein